MDEEWRFSYWLIVNASLIIYLVKYLQIKFFDYKATLHPAAM